MISCGRNILRLKAYTTTSDKIKFKCSKKLNTAHIFIQSCHGLKLLVCMLLFFMAFIHQRLIERFPVARPCPDMEIRNAPQDCFVGHCRRHRCKSFSAATFTGFEYRCAMLFCCFTIQYFTFATTAAARADTPLSLACFTGSRHNLFYFGPLLPVRWANSSRTISPVRRRPPRERNLACDLGHGRSASSVTAGTSAVGGRRPRIFRKSKLRQRNHAAPERFPRGFTHIFWCCLDGKLRQRLSRQLFVSFADPGLPEERSQTEPRAAAGRGCAWP